MKTDINKIVKSSGLDYFRVLLEITKNSFQYDSRRGIKIDAKKESVKKIGSVNLK